VPKLHAQFSGSITLGGFHTTNADVSTTSVGKDTTTPDNVVNPTLDLLYNWDISAPANIKFDLSLSPNIFTIVPARSYEKSTFSATGIFYLSDVEEKAKPMPPTAHVDSAAPVKKSVQEHSALPDTSKPQIVIRSERVDIPVIVSGKLSDLSGLLDSFDYDDKGLSDDSSDAVSDLKDSFSESVLALSELLTSEIFTESIASVVSSETANQKKIFSQVPMEPARKKEINDDFDSIIVLMKGAKPQNDILPTPKPKEQVETVANVSSGAPSEKKDIINQALAHLQTNDKETTISKEEDAPVLTLVNTQTEFKDLSSQDILLKEDLSPLTKKTLATELTVPASAEIQNNKKGNYLSYSYNQYECAPRLDLYSGKSFAFGTTYDVTKLQFPFDSVHVNDGTENKLRFDTRIQGESIFVFSADGGISIKNFDFPLKYYVPVTGKQDKLVSTATNYSHFFLGAGLMFFPADRFSISVSGAFTHSNSLRPYLIDSTRAALLGRTRVGGTQNDDQYSYDLTRFAGFAVWRIFYDMDLSVDYAYEDRTYSNQQLARVATRAVPHPKPVTIKREDTGPLIGLELKKEFLFDSRVASIFDSFTPSFNVLSTNYTSTVKLFSYQDVTSTLSLEFGF